MEVANWKHHQIKFGWVWSQHFVFGTTHDPITIQHGNTELMEVVLSAPESCYLAEVWKCHMSLLKIGPLPQKEEDCLPTIFGGGRVKLQGCIITLLYSEIIASFHFLYDCTDITCWNQYLYCQISRYIKRTYMYVGMAWAFPTSNFCMVSRRMIHNRWLKSDIINIYLASQV